MQMFQARLFHCLVCGNVVQARCDPAWEPELRCCHQPMVACGVRDVPEHDPKPLPCFEFESKSAKGKAVRSVPSSDETWHN